MRDIFTVFRFTLRDGLRKKAFIITTVAVLVVILIACALPGLLSGGDGGETETPENTAKTGLCFVADQENLIPGAIEALSAAYPYIDFQPADAARLADAKARVEQERRCPPWKFFPETPGPGSWCTPMTL